MKHEGESQNERALVSDWNGARMSVDQCKFVIKFRLGEDIPTGAKKYLGEASLFWNSSKVFVCR